MPIDRKPTSPLVQFMDLLFMELTNWRWSWRGIVLTSLVAPMLGIVALGSLAQHGAKESLVYILTGNLVMSLMFGNLGNVANRFVFMRMSGTLDYYATLPIQKVALMLAVVVAFFLLSLPSFLVAIAFGAWFLKLTLTLNITLLLVVPLCVLSLAGVGAFIGTTARTPDEGNSLALLVTMVLLFIGPVLIPPDRLPNLLIALGWFSPATYAASALRQTLIATTSRLMVDLFALFAWTAVSLWSVRQRLSWQQRS
jgi:ABC-2 type transport system permease protein